MRYIKPLLLETYRNWYLICIYILYACYLSVSLLPEIWYMPHRWADDCSLVRQFWISQCPMYPARRAECPARFREASLRQMWASALRWSCWCATEAAWRRWSVTWADRVVIDCADIAVLRGRSVRLSDPGSPPRAARVNRTLVVCLQREARFKHQLIIYIKGIYIIL